MQGSFLRSLHVLRAFDAFRLKTVILLPSTVYCTLLFYQMLYWLRSLLILLPSFKCVLAANPWAGARGQGSEVDTAGCIRPFGQV